MNDVIGEILLPGGTVVFLCETLQKQYYVEVRDRKGMVLHFVMPNAVDLEYN